MKKLLLVIGIIALFSSAAFTQEEKLKDVPASFQTFFATFKSAVVKGRKNAVAEMTRFPFHYAFDAGDEGTMTKKKFIAKFRTVFDKDEPTYWTDEYLTFSRGDRGEYQITDNSSATHLTFVKAGKTYQLTGYFVEP